jgi:hypothetical protein
MSHRKKIMDMNRPREYYENLTDAQLAEMPMTLHCEWVPPDRDGYLPHDGLSPLPSENGLSRKALPRLSDKPSSPQTT